MNFSIHQASHIGNRRFNQDRVAYAYSSEALLLVLADGMGGHLHGERAAGMAVETFIDAFIRNARPAIADPDAFVSSIMSVAQESIMEFSHDNALGGFPGSTCVAALMQEDKIYWGHAGDSRLYLIRDGKVLIRTRDHSLVHQWFERGMLTAEQARIHPQRNQITNCLGGIDDIFYVELGEPFELLPGDIVLLGSDGLWGPMEDSELVSAFSSGPVDDALEKLIDLALKRENGHSDNITGVVVRWGVGEANRNTVEPVSCILEIP